MPKTGKYDVAVIGGGIVGLATARALARRGSNSVLVLEAEDRLAAHQTGNNSGVIHSGLYYKPGSLKARNCTQGREALYRFCEEQGIAHERCGKIVVATDELELPRLEQLEQRGRENGLVGIERLNTERLREYEPHVAAVGGLLVPETGIVNYTQVAEAYARQLRERDAEIITAARVTGVEVRSDGFVLQTEKGAFESRFLINCGGLQSDRIAHMCGFRPALRIVPFRGEYYKLIPEREELVRNLIYPVPDPRFPFLGVHFTRMIEGGVEAGPNAVLALKREGYGKLSFSARDSLDIFSYGGFWRMASRHWSTAMGEVYRSFSKAAFVRALNKLIPALSEADLKPHGSGVRAQAVLPDGSLADDFRFIEAERMLHVLNAPSPAATASLSIGDSLADRACELFGWEKAASTHGVNG
jgi:L-2-hydroxyglutarate oxidase